MRIGSIGATGQAGQDVHREAVRRLQSPAHRNTRYTVSDA